MYTVLIAEDELLVRIGMVNCVPWAKLGMCVVDEVADGQAAWNAFQQYRPDIIITDIRMPEIDGLELLRRIRSVDPTCAIIVVTNVENADIMDETRKLNVVSIMLKAVMTQEDIVEAVVRARDSLPYPPPNTRVEVNHRDLWTEFLLDKNLNYDQLCQKFFDRGSEPEQIRGMILVHLFPDESQLRRMKYSMEDIVEHRLQETCSFHSIETMSGAILLLKTDIKRAELERTLKELAWYISTHFAVQMGFVLQPECERQDCLPEYAAKAAKMVREQAFFDDPVFLFTPSGQPDFQELRRSIRQLMRYEVLGCERKYHAAVYAQRLENLLNLLSSGWTAVREEGLSLLSALGNSGECAGLHGLIRNLTDAVEAAIAQIRSDTRPEILSAIEYIEDHLEEDLSIQSVSRIVNYHHVYFSNMFKKETGMNYSDFVANVRINRAKRMLSGSSRTLQEIADDCGFKNLSYFCSKFKHVTGMTPGQWREKT